MNNKLFSLKISCLLIGLVLLCPMLFSQEIEDLSRVNNLTMDQILNNIEGKAPEEVKKEFADHYFDTIMESCADCFTKELGSPLEEMKQFKPVISFGTVINSGDSEEAAKRTGYRDYDGNIIGPRMSREKEIGIMIAERVRAHFRFLDSERQKEREAYSQQKRQEMWIIITTFLLSFFVLFKLYNRKYEANFLMDPVAIVLCVAIFLSYGFGWDATDGIKGFPKNLDELLLAINPMNYPTPGYKLLYFIGLGSLITLLIRNIGKSNFFWGVIQTFYQVIILGFIGILLLLAMFKGGEKISKAVKENKKEIATGAGIGAGFFGAKALSKKRKEKKNKPLTVPDSMKKKE